MKVAGVEIKPEWLEAGRAAMVGRFTFAHVQAAMRRAGCGDEAYRAADRLLQVERKAGRIEAVSAREWSPLSTTGGE